MRSHHAFRDDGTVYRYCLGVVMGVSVILRVIIARSGGEFYWTDEGRYGTSRIAAGDFTAGHFRAGMDILFQGADHLLFKFAGLAPAWAETYFGPIPWVPAVFFGSFSVILIYLVWRLVLELGGSMLEALFAAMLIAECNTFFYYARHVFPYDLSLCLFLCSAICGARRGLWSNLLTGSFSGTAFLCYEGYWLFGAVILILATLSRWKPTRGMMAYAFVAVVGLLLPVVAIGLVGRLLGHDFLKSLIEFSGHSSGDVGSAWRLVGEYFWASEHLLVIFWSVASLFGIALCLITRVEPRVVWSLSGTVLYYSSIVVYSDVLRHYALFARHLRPMAIFQSLIGAWFLTKLLGGGKLAKVTCYMLLAGILVQAGWNMRVPLGQEFPVEFKKRAQSVISKDMEQHFGLYQIWSDGYYEDAEVMESRPFRVLDRSPHPIQFIPYTLDAWNEKLRAAFRTQDLSMRVVRLLPEKPEGQPQITRIGGPWSPYLGAVRLRVIFSQGPSNLPQPLICSGKTGNGDLVFVEFMDHHTIRIGVDHWGAGAVYSKPILSDLTQSHIVDISLGSLYPEKSDKRFKENPRWLKLKDSAFVGFDGALVIDKEMESYNASPGSVEIFHNLQGFSTSVHDFAGRFLSASWVEPADLLPSINAGYTIGPIRKAQTGGHYWSPYTGAVRITAIFDPWHSKLPQPLLSCGKTGAGDEVFVEYVNSHTIRLGVDHWGAGAVYSEPIPCDLSQPHVVDISLGSLYPEESSKQFQNEPRLRLLHNLVLVKFDDAMVIDKEMSGFTALPSSVTAFHNYLGFSTAVRDFEGTALSMTPIAPDELLK